MIRRQQHGLVWLEWPLLDGFAELQHRIFTRHGGVSLAPYASLNLSYGVGDDPARVGRNRALVREAMGLAELISVGQIHGSNTLILTDRQKVAAAGAVEGIDILITNLPEVGLLIKQADCQAVALYDPEHRVIANIHCGWRGNVQNVIGQAVRQLQEVFGSRPAALYAGISPSLGPCCAALQNFRRELPPEFWRYQVRPTYFDLWQLSVDQLLAAGLVRSRIQLAGLCSRCQAEDFFSYRREKVTGRNGTVVALRPASGDNRAIHRP
ncbi:MAG: polyphenol oxidase family protein [Desulfobacca sp.]|uniref:polyphenol oxidase family protein n=1 Tax=Desulfobacca sp. TaxID=2067990 RepID=UPI00404A9CBE